MKTLDRYILSEFAGPFVFGLGLFFTLLVGVDVLYDILRMSIRHQVPMVTAIEIAAYTLPATFGLTVPMAAMFASLMAFARLSSEGELIAIRVGGASVRRVGVAVLVACALLSLVLAVLVHTWIPACSGTSTRMLAEYRGTLKAIRHLMLRIPESGPMERMVYVDKLDPSRGEMEWVVIHEFKEGQPWVTLVAKRARWGGNVWVLEQLEHTRITPKGSRSERLSELRYDLGRTPEDLERVKYKPYELRTSELWREVQVVTSGPSADAGRAAQIRMEIANRWAAPWAVLGMALVGVALGVRPQRTSRGMALGMSLAVVLLYYIVVHTMTIVGEQGRLPAPLCAWLANAALAVVGLTGLFSHDR